MGYSTFLLKIKIDLNSIVIQLLIFNFLRFKISNEYSLFFFNNSSTIIFRILRIYLTSKSISLIQTIQLINKVLKRSLATSLNYLMSILMFIFKVKYTL